MFIKKRLYPPENWKDFEELCLKLWGELWEIPNQIDFNSTNSQGQDGVDIYGVPKGQKEYYGIQCKNLKPLTKSGKINSLTKNSILKEISKAEKFEPPLKHLVFATTIEKDKNIEEFVRNINIERIRQNKFSVQICFWEFIADKLFENKNLFNWYSNNQEFLGTKKVNITFEKNNSIRIKHNPKYNKVTKLFRLENEEDIKREKSRLQKLELSLKNSSNYLKASNKVLNIINLLKFKKEKSNNLLKSEIFVNGIDVNSTEYKKSLYPKRVFKSDFDENNKNLNQIFSLKNTANNLYPIRFRINIKNVGLSVIENFKLKLFIEGEFDSIDTKNPKLSEVLSNNYNPDVFVKGYKCYVLPNKDYIIQNDDYISDEIVIIPTIGIESEIIVKWEFLSRDYSDKGELIIEVKPKYEYLISEYLVSDEKDCRVEEFIEYKSFEYTPTVYY